MKRTDTKSTSSQAVSVANWTLLAAASIAWIGIVIHMVIRLDLMRDGLQSPLNSIVLGTILLGIAAGVANIGYHARTENLSRQWLLIGMQIAAGLLALYLSRINTPAMMLIIGMAQVPARTGVVAIGVVFGAANIALGVIFLVITSTPAQALVEWFLFMGFQLFAITVAVSQQRERLTRESLAEVNAELVATRGLVASSARTEERLRVSRELHDIAGHTLTAIKVRLEAHALRAPGELRTSLLATGDLAKALLEDIRAVVSHLRQHDPIRLRESLRSICDGFPDASVHLSIDDDLHFERAEQSSAILRCVQEAVTNAVRHGAARNIWIVGEKTQSELEFTVRDDGVGGLDYELGNGLRGMNERLIALGGHLEIKPSKSEGWTLRMHFPRFFVSASQAAT